MTSIFKNQVLLSAILFILLIFTYHLYSFGLSSGFFLDDPSNLQALDKITAFDFNQIAMFSLSGTAGPTGRPLSLLTFALQFPDWPNNPSAFKFVNLMIHLINTILVFILGKQLFKFHSETRNKCFELALLVATIWAIHPIQVSTVLYCIQRMTELSATFVLLGIITYLYGRKQLTDSVNTKPAYLWMSAGLIFGTLLSIINKENGILIFLFILVIEKTIFNSLHPLFKSWQSIFIYLPIAIIFSYLFYKFDTSHFRLKPYTFEERLMTENAVIFDYLRKIITPSFNSFSLFHDNFPISKSLTDSFQTLAGFLIISSTTLLSIIYRKKYPLISFGFLWYYSGLILESSIIPIELYFEHRNYLPLFGIVFAIVALSYKAACHFKSNTASFVIYSLLFLFIIYLSFLTYEETTLWGKKHQAKLTWAIEKPNSTRAQSSAANVLAFQGNFTEAINFTKKLIKLTPNDPSPHIAWLQYRCYTDTIPPPNMELLYQLAQHGKIGLSSIFILNNIILDMNKDHCKNVTYPEIKKIFKNIEQNSTLIRHADFHQIYALFEGGQGHYLSALNQGEKSLTYKPSVRVALFQVRWLTLLGDYQAAHNYLIRVKEINASLSKTSILFKSSINTWESFLNEKLSLTKISPD